MTAISIGAKTRSVKAVGEKLAFNGVVVGFQPDGPRGSKGGWIVRDDMDGTEWIRETRELELRL
jgi:hypothetical protein